MSEQKTELPKDDADDEIGAVLGELRNLSLTDDVIGDFDFKPLFRRCAHVIETLMLFSRNESEQKMLLLRETEQANGDTLRVHVHDRGSGFEKTYTLRAPDEWLEHDARHIVEGDVGTTESLMDFAKRVLAMIGAP